MKYETLTELKGDISLASGATATFTFTYTYNIDRIVCLSLTSAGANSTYRNFGYCTITSISFTGNVLTVIVTNKYNSGTIEDLFLLATVASY